MPNPVNVASNAFNVERVRAQMLEGVRMPPDLLQKAIDKLHTKIDAKKTQFFPFQGKVIEEVVVEDHQTQLAAIDKVLAISGVYVRERESAPSAPTVALEMDPRTGIVRLVVGVGGPIAVHETSVHALPDGASLQLPLVAVEGLTTLSSPPAQETTMPTLQEEDKPEVIRVRKGNLPIGVFNALFGEPNGDGPS